MIDTNKRKRALEDVGDVHEDGYYSEQQHLATCLIPRPPSPPCTPILRLVAHHSCKSSALDLLPSHQSLAVLTEATSIGRDRSYEPRIRLKSMEVSKTHATLFIDDQSSGSTEGEEGCWYIVDNASTHGTYVRPLGKTDWQRLSEKGTASKPHKLRHLDQLRIASQRFHVHLHQDTDFSCSDCLFGQMEDEVMAARHLIPLADSASRSSISNRQSPERPLESTRSKEQKWQDFKTDMRSLRSAMLSGDVPNSATAAAAAQPADPQSGQSRATTQSQRVYIDRAKMRRQAHGSSVQHRKTAESSPYHRRTSPVLEARPAAPTYGMGQALLERMTKQVPPREDEDDSTISPRRHLGTIVEVRTSDISGAGIGSARLLQSVEEIATRNAWPGGQLQDKRQQRWTAALARDGG